VIYAGVSFAGSLMAAHLSPIWYGVGFTAASFLAFSFSYFRLRWIEKNMDTHVFCRGTVLKQVNADMPAPDVYNVYKKKTALIKAK
jgi:uncharacterized membrane protein